jgi:hypothetical protein
LKRSLLFIAILIVSILFYAAPAAAQYKIKGTVYDSTRSYAIPSVSVLTSSGRGTMTNANGDYEIEVAETDSVWFSYLNQPTIKFPVLKISSPHAFDISLQVNVPVLKEVRIRQRNYRQDSLSKPRRLREDF